jgi:predicted transcriptional regulator
MSSPELRLHPPSEQIGSSITELFHRINSVLPDDQRVLSVPGDMLASEALELLNEHRYSQLPVIIGDEVIGMFSYRSFSRTVMELAYSKARSKAFLEDLTVEECYEPAEFARITDEFQKWFDVLDDHNAVLVGEPQLLQGVVTPMDVLRYLYQVAKPFVLVAEIETCLRALIRIAADTDQLAECAKTALARVYSEETLPTRLEDMTFHDYVQIIGDGRNWSRFHPVLRGTRERTRAKLEEMNELRNGVFHLREISLEDHQRLASLRDWMLVKARAADALAREGNP